MEKEENEIGYWSDKKIWGKALLLSSISLFAVVPIYLLLKAMEKKKKEVKEENGKKE